MTIFVDMTFRKVIKVKQGLKGGALIQQDWCPYIKKSHQGYTLIEERPCGHLKAQEVKEEIWGL